VATGSNFRSRAGCAADADLRLTRSDQSDAIGFEPLAAVDYRDSHPLTRAAAASCIEAAITYHRHRARV
jgi:hypothetical protein